VVKGHRDRETARIPVPGIAGDAGIIHKLEVIG